MKIFPSLYMGILMQVLKHAWACTCISHQKVCLCSATVWGYIKHTYAQIFTDCISLSFLRCLQPINIHLSGISLSLSLVPHDRASEVSVRVLFLIWYFCCQSASWSLASETLKRIKKRKRAKTSEFVKEKKEYRLVLYTVRNSGSQKQHVPAAMCATANLSCPKQPVESCCFLFTPLALLCQVFVLYDTQIKYTDIYRWNMCLLSPSVSRQMDVCFFSKELNLNCLHCMVELLGLEVGRNILPGIPNTVKGSKMRLWWRTARLNRHICAVMCN